MGSCVGKVCTFTDVEDIVEFIVVDSKVDFMTNRLPTEILLKILCYLPTRDKIIMRNVSRRLRHVSQTPSLWKELVWPDYEPRHVRQVSDILRTYGEHVRRILFPAHVCTAPLKVLEMARCCTKVIHLSLSKLSLDHIEEILCIMPHLQQLDLCIDGRYMACTQYSLRDNNFFEGLLRVTAARVRKLKLQINTHDNSVCAIAKLIRWADEGNPLPPLIDIFAAIHNEELITNFLVFWSKSSSKLLSHEISLYSNKRIPMNFHPPMPICTFQSGPAATPPLIQLGDHGLDIFCIGQYDHNGAVRYTISPGGGFTRTGWYWQYNVIERAPHVALIYKQHYNSCMNILHAISYVDMSYSKVQCSILEQLAIVCPNLQRLNLKGNGECLVRLRGLYSIVHACQNLEGLNLAGIQLLSVESSLGLWEIISRIKKLTHLTIDLCMLTSYEDHKRCLINMFKRCHSLKALELCCSLWCSKCIDTKVSLLSHFPSLAHCRMSNVVYSGFKHAITNCHKLKYLYETNAYEELVNDKKLSPFTCICPLQQLYIVATYFNVTDELARALSAHGGLECVVLHVNSITINSIISIIKYSPNLVLLNVASKQILFDENCKQHLQLDYTDYIMKKFSYHKLFAIGSFTVRIAGNSSAYLFNTDLNSLWV